MKLTMRKEILMKKRMLSMLLFILLVLSGCKSDPPAPTDQPWALEVEYGDSGVTAAAWDYTWNYPDGETGQTQKAEVEEADPLALLSAIPFVNRSKTGKLNLRFAVEPDSLEIACYTNADGYGEAVSVEASGSKNTIPVPTEDGSYLFQITASWNQGEDVTAWGDCTYYFRYLPEGDTGEQTGEISLYRILKLTPDELFGVEVFHNGLSQQKTCRTTDDKAVVLDFLKNNLATDFVQVKTPSLEAEFVLRLAVTDGSQLTLGYIPLDGTACLLLGGVPYEAGVMDMEQLWSAIQADPVSLAEQAPEDTLETSEEDPGAALGDNYVHGYLRALDDAVTFDQMKWIDDSEDPNGYRLEAGELGKEYPLADDCTFWILQDHRSPYCRVAQETLWDWAQTTGWDVLFRFYLENGEVVAIIEQFRP